MTEQLPPLIAATMATLCAGGYAVGLKLLLAIEHRLTRMEDKITALPCVDPAPSCPEETPGSILLPRSMPPKLAPKPQKA